MTASARAACVLAALAFASAGCARAARPVAEPRPERIAYGEDPEWQSLDLYPSARSDGPAPPRAPPRAPIVAFVHGGGWSEPDQGGHEPKAAYFTRAGFVFALIRYRLSPEVVHPAHVDDVARALGWLRRNAARFGGDPDAIFLLGHSSGAHLAALAAVAPEHLLRHGVPHSAIRAAALLDGSAYDLVTRVPASGGWMRRMLEGAFGPDPAVWADASPARRIDPSRPPPPMLIFHLAGRAQSQEQANALAEALRRAGGEAEVVAVADRDHATINRLLGTEGDEVAPRILRFFAGAAAGR